MKKFDSKITEIEEGLRFKDSLKQIGRGPRPGVTTRASMSAANAVNNINRFRTGAMKGHPGMRHVRRKPVPGDSRASKFFKK